MDQRERDQRERDQRRRRAALEAERDRLVVLRGALEADRGEVNGAHGSELSHLDQHQADDGSDLFEDERARSLLLRVRADIAEFDDALARLDGGTYGRCEACGRPIPDERLDAVPATRLCIGHEALSEGSSAMALPGGWRYADRGIDVDDPAGRHAAHFLEFLPADDELDEPLDLGAEERAVRVHGMRHWPPHVPDRILEALADHTEPGPSSTSRP